MSYGYKLLAGAKHTNNRNMILRLFLALRMSEDEIQKALNLYGMKPLNKRDKRDRVILLAPAYHSDIDDIEKWLINLDFEPLFDY